MPSSALFVPPTTALTRRPRRVPRPSRPSSLSGYATTRLRGVVATAGRPSPSPSTPPPGPPSASPLPRRILAVGEVLLDCFSSSPTTPFDAPTGWTVRPGGAPANVAAAAAALGAPASLLTAVGDDPDGEKLIAALTDAGVDVGGVQVVGGATTRRVYVRPLEGGAGGEGVFAGLNPRGVGGYADEQVELQAAEEVSAVEGKVAEGGLSATPPPPSPLAATVVENVGWLATGTLCLATPTTAAAVRAAAAAVHAAGGRVLVDVNWRPLFWADWCGPSPRTVVTEYVAAAADVVKLSAEEVEWLLDIPAADAVAAPERVLAALRAAQPRDGDAAAAAAARSAGVRLVLVTAGAAGAAYALGPSGSGRPAPPVTGRVAGVAAAAVDTTGAGDEFVGAFLAELLAADAAAVAAAGKSGSGGGDRGGGSGGNAGGDGGGGGDALDNPAVVDAAVRFATTAAAMVTEGVGAMAPQPGRAAVAARMVTAGVGEAASEC
ncbi:hypothetical protein I4F81_002164 [Pyropia yezoensis]|uniref:Uncharacterized protein n=1 Tax=Pyropia yezoensis TaxID=2788 RepID=A0ACC3BPB9_PYRYE|nr:hypothetical protein I4F81_002164 [Neopyropia yezoensis]